MTDSLTVGDSCWIVGHAITGITLDYRHLYRIMEGGEILEGRSVPWFVFMTHDTREKYRCGATLLNRHLIKMILWSKSLIV